MGKLQGINSVAHHLLEDDRFIYHEALPRQEKRTVVLPSSLDTRVTAALERTNIASLYRFQADAIEALLGGEHIVLAGGTGSGKSLCYQVPILEHLAKPLLDTQAVGEQRKRTALYLAPTKALAQDQARRLRELDAAWARPMLYDGDTPKKARAMIRKQANLLLTNPDMLSTGILPAHSEWASFLRGLSVVVIDEAHVYRGVFGSHVAKVIWRLRRLLNAYGNEHVVFCCSSATIGNPAEHMQRLVGVDDVRVISDYGAPQQARDLLFYNPELDEDTDDRDSALGDAARLFVQLLEADQPTIVFCRTRNSCELVHKIARDMLRSRGAHDLAAAIAPYRAGYTPEERRETEKALASGKLRGVVATSALELGIDIGKLSASIVVTFPGTITSLWQRWGRAARGENMRGTCILVAGDDALDQYFMRFPETLLEREAEHAVISLTNPRITAPHLLAAANELPLSEQEYPKLAGELIDRGALVKAPHGLVGASAQNAAYEIALRGVGGTHVMIIDAVSAQLLGTVEVARAASSVYPGAIYLHRGESYIVEDLNPARLEAIVRKHVAPYYTIAKIDTQIQVLEAQKTLELSPELGALNFGRVLVTDTHQGYQRIKATTHTPLDLIEQYLPPIEFETEAVWFSCPPEVEKRFDVDQLLGAIHAAEHGMIALLPLLATCDRWDIGGLSINYHEAFDGPGIFIYDGHPGGVGICETGFDRFYEWVRTSLDAIRTCPCESGCPSCVQSPKCGNLNEPLYKQGAIFVLEQLLATDS